MEQCKIYMHSFYPDLGAVTPSVLTNYVAMERVMVMQKRRDAELAGWLKHNNIPSFPMSQSEFDGIAHLLRFLTDANRLVCLLFTKVNGDGRDMGCNVLRAGKFEPYPSRVEAMRALSGSKHDLAVINASVYTEDFTFSKHTPKEV